MIETNAYQTPITDELLDSLHKEIREEFLDLINNVEFIKRLISPNRKRAKDLERDEKGRIIVDLVNPHILEDMDYFRPSALYFQKYGVYTHLRPNNNPNSEFAKWIKEEVRRIWEGYVRPSDGEWVPGDLYYYMNYSPIIQSKYKKGQKKATRIVDLPKTWEGIYLRFHYWEQARNGGLYNNWEGGEHCAEIAKRGSSKSYSMASTLAKYFLHGEDADSNREIRSVITAYQKEFLTKDGTLNKFISMIDFCAENTEFPSKRLKQSMQEMHWRLGYIDMNTGTSRGLLNEVIGVSSKDDTDKLRGKRASKIFIEEFGNFPSIGEIHRVLLPSVEDGSVVFGQLIYCGTGGSEGADFAGAMDMMYSPRGYRIYSLPNVYDKNSQGKQDSIFFFGAYLNREGFYNQDGVSDVVAALIDILKNRFIVKYNTSDPNALTKTKAENPCTLQEAIMKRDGSIYPVADLTDVENMLNVTPSLLDSIFPCTLEINKDGEVIAKPEYDNKPIRTFPHQDNKLTGCCEIHKFPEIDNSTKKPYNYRYIAGIDPYDDDSSTTLSLGSIFILDLWTDKIVFEFTGRPLFAADFYEICRRAIILYNARANYENNKKGLFAHFSKYNSLFLLTDTLDFLKDKDFIKGENLTNKTKGTVATEPVKKYGRMLIRNWLLKPVTRIENVDGQEVEIIYPNLQDLRQKALIRELCLHNLDGNFDRHDALLMLMLLREDRLRLCGTDSAETANRKEDKNYLGNDEFFSKNYKRRTTKNTSIDM